MDAIGDTVVQVPLHDDDVDGGEGDGHDDDDADDDLLQEVGGHDDPAGQDPEALDDDERRDEDDVDQRRVRIRVDTEPLREEEPGRGDDQGQEAQRNRDQLSPG